MGKLYLACVIAVASIFNLKDISYAKTPINIAGFFPISSDKYYQQLVKSIEIATEHVNQFDNILADYELRIIYNWTEGNSARALSVLHDFIYNKPQFLMAWGPIYSRVGQTLNQVAAKYNLVQVCIAQLSGQNYDKYSHSVHIYPSAAVFNPARLRLLRQMGWKRVGIIFQNYDVFRKEMEQFASMLYDEGLQVLTIEHITGSPADNIDSLIRHDVRIIFGGFYQDMAAKVLCEAYRRGMRGPKYVWITLGWYHADWWAEEAERQLSNGNDFCQPEELASLVEGSLSMRGLEFGQNLSMIHFQGVYPTQDQLVFYQHLQSKLETVGACDAYGYDQIITIALALNNSLEVLANMKPPRRLEDFTYSDTKMAQIFRQQALALSFLGLSGHVSFDVYGVRLSNAVVQQIQDSKVRQIFSIDRIENNVKWFTDFKWPDGIPPVDGISWMYANQQIDGRIKIVSFTITSIGVAMAVLFLIINVMFRNLSVIKITSPKLNNIIAVGSICLYCSVYCYAFRLEIKHDPNAVLYCQVSSVLICIGLSLSFGALFVKTYRVHYIYTSAMKARKTKLLITDARLLVAIGGFVFLDIIIFVIWNLVDSIHLETIEIGHWLVDTKREIFKMSIMNKCTSAKDFVFIATIFVYKGCMLIFGIFLAWSTKDVRISQLNDSKNIAMSVYVVGLTCAIAVPLTYIYDGSDGNLDLTFIFVSIALILCNTTVLCLVFVPKILAIREHDGTRIDTFNQTERTTTTNASDDRDAIITTLFNELNQKESTLASLVT